MTINRKSPKITGGDDLLDKEKPQENPEKNLPAVLIISAIIVATILRILFGG